MSRSKYPSRWSYKHGAFYFQVPTKIRHLWKGKAWYRLGKTETEAYKAWHDQLARIDALDGTGEDAVLQASLRLMSGVFNAYEHHEIPKKAPSTQRGYRGSLAILRPVFGNMTPGSIKPRHAYQFLDHRPPVAGNRDLAVLIKALDFAVCKGVIDRNPLKGQVQRNSEKPRERLVKQSELDEFLRDANFMLRGYVGLKRITGARQAQLLSIYLPEQWNDGVLTIPGSKRGRDVEYEGGHLEAIIDCILYERWGSRIRHIGHLFTSRNGNPYTVDGFRSIWQRQMRKFVRRGGERFTEHDIRAMTATEAETLEHAAALLGHQDKRTTLQIYRRGPNRVSVLNNDVTGR